APSSGIVSEWLNSPLWHRDIGAGFSYQAEALIIRDVVPRRSFDALLFVESTSRARAIESGPRSPSAPNSTGQGQVESPENLDFEDVDADGTPKGWITYSDNLKAGYAVAASHSNPFHGKQCASLLRDRAPWRWGYGLLFQRLNAASYRGKHIRFRAAARAEIS